MSDTMVDNPSLERLPEANIDDQAMPGSEEEDQGDAVDDSSEEDEEDEEAAKRVREGFIVDDEDEDEDEEQHRRRRRRRKHRKRRNSDDEDDGDEALEDDDLELLAENTGGAVSKLNRLRRGRDPSGSVSPPPDRKRKTGVVLSDEDEDFDKPGPSGKDRLQGIWDDDRGMDRDEDDIDMDDDMGAFIEYEDEDESAEIDEDEREARRRERRRREKERRREMAGRSELQGVHPAVWEEMLEVFGDGRDYDWALSEDERDQEDKPEKPALKYADVFEPTQIIKQHLTAEDDLVRQRDIPERMQLVVSSLTDTRLSLHPEFPEHGLEGAAEWVCSRLSSRIQITFFRPGSPHHRLLPQFVLAVTGVLKFLLIDFFEVPYIYYHRRDHLYHFDPNQTRDRVEFLTLAELWDVYALGQKYQSLLERRNTLELNYERLGISDDYYVNEIRQHLDSIETIADSSEWLNTKYRVSKKDSYELQLQDEDAVETRETRKHKAPSRISAYEIAKRTIASKLAEGYGISPENVVQNYFTEGQHFPEDRDIPPLDYAEQFVDPDPDKALPAEEMLRRARMILATELGKNPLLRRDLRALFMKHGTITCIPTDRGIKAIHTESHYYNFKYLLNKPVQFMLETSQFLRILKAEEEGLITIEVRMEASQEQTFKSRLEQAISSDGFSDTTRAWNEERRLIIQEAWEHHLSAMAIKWLREWLRDQVEDRLSEQCASELRAKTNTLPYQTSGSQVGEIPRVLAVSWGQGDPAKDLVSYVLMDEGGRVLEHNSLDNLVDETPKVTFKAVISRGKPHVIVISGLSIATTRLYARIKDILREVHTTSDSQQPNGASSGAPIGETTSGNGWGEGGGNDTNGWGSQANGVWGTQPSSTGGWGNSTGESSSGWGQDSGNSGGWDQGATSTSGQWDQQPNGSSSWSGGDISTTPASGSGATDTIPVIFIHDDVARIYQHSKRATDEFGSMPVTTRYCVGLARFVQSPLNEYAAMGSDLTTLPFKDNGSHLITPEKFLKALERALVDVVCSVGVDINRATHDEYYGVLLSFVAGLGPRKADQLRVHIRAVVRHFQMAGFVVVADGLSQSGVQLVNRDQLVTSNLLTTKIFLNTCGFLRIPFDPQAPTTKRRSPDLLTQADPLDDTRIHVEDYELARKMATDALELDEEDVHDEHPSHVVTTIMADPDNAKKLDELNLDDFAISMFQNNGDRKRHTLSLIHDELLKPYEDHRTPFQIPNDWEILTMLTSESPDTLKSGFIVTVSVVRIKAPYLYVRLESGIDGLIHENYIADEKVNLKEFEKKKKIQKGQTMPGVIVDVKMDKAPSTYSVELSTRPFDLQSNDSEFRKVIVDQEYFDTQREARDNELQQRKKRSEVNQARRVIKHPQFQNVNSSQAEFFLDDRPQGDYVIRPSSKGHDHLAVTWKVHDNLYQHIDVVERNVGDDPQSAGELIVDGKYNYSDLDDLAVNHVAAIQRRFNDLMAHEKFKGTTEDELHSFLRNYVAANPGKSNYGFAINRKRPGHFLLSFLTNQNAALQAWTVRVGPDAYYLFNSPATGVSELCDAFKYRYAHEAARSAQGGRTPYGAGRMTPGRQTPSGRMSVRQPARTPNPYSVPAPGTVPPPPPAAIGMHPSRTAMLQSSTSGWGSGGNGW